jgi:hypothetical protein
MNRTYLFILVFLSVSLLFAKGKDDEKKFITLAPSAGITYEYKNSFNHVEEGGEMDSFVVHEKKTDEKIFITCKKADSSGIVMEYVVGERKLGEYYLGVDDVDRGKTGGKLGDIIKEKGGQKVIVNISNKFGDITGWEETHNDPDKHPDPRFSESVAKTFAFFYYIHFPPESLGKGSEWEVKHRYKIPYLDGTQYVENRLKTYKITGFGKKKGRNCVKINVSGIMRLNTRL